MHVIKKRNKYHKLVKIISPHWCHSNAGERHGAVHATRMANMEYLHFYACFFSKTFGI